ncbi:hypothetical protein SUGI_0566120 [Cryptomeria japonica]|uniref:2-acetamido-2-deoxy-D-galactose-binding seed lectin 2-like n=1 Tax=Cryptomeria japonica TaxID=3369 RepID=UPI002408CAE9|nr:2-acetamido-2-deoxy-D-galactose-binding seed lectin 2-like [Cryptomeria japonica]GLJ28725.1 hypothetical protein SUGI_0566120 [Cryptomeria japonica]
MAITTLPVVAVSVILHLSILGISPLEAKNAQVSFEWNSSAADHSPANRIALGADAIFVNTGVLQLTDSMKGLRGNGSVGRAAYNETISLWDASTKAVANFTTHFQFQMDWTNQSTADVPDYGGDGLSFFMGRRESDYNLSFTGKNGYLGLFSPDNDGKSSTKLLVVEFDTYSNSPWDKDSNHIGIDVNTINSAATRPLHQRLNGGETWDVRVDYRGQENVLEVFASCRCNGKGPWKLAHKIDLTHYLPEEIVVGFSATAFK